MMKRSLLMTVALVWLGACASCARFQPIAEYPPIDQLVIDEAPFPPGWRASIPDMDFPPLAPWSSGRRELEYIDRSYYSERGGRAFLRIRRFGGSDEAVKEYTRKVGIAFRETEWNTPWIIPAGLEFKSAVANRYQYACSIEGVEGIGRPTCAYVAQYEVYVLEFYIDFYDSHVITYTDLISIYQAIDEHMTIALDSR